MFNLFKRRWVKIVTISLAAFVTSISMALAFLMWDRRPPEVKAVYALLSDWQSFCLDPTTRLKSAEEKTVFKTAFAKRCLELSDTYPNSASEIFALQMAASWTKKTDFGKQAKERLCQKVKTSDLETIALGTENPGGANVPDIAPLIVERAKGHLDHPYAYKLLVRACVDAGYGSEEVEVPPAFTEAADLIVKNFAERPLLEGFINSVGNGYYSPHWASQFEPHLRTILKVNPSRWIRCCAALSLATFIHANPDRQPEAEKLLEEFLLTYDGKDPYLYQNLELSQRDLAKTLLERLHHSPLWKPAPEMVGVDLAGKPLRLSEYRGKVVMVSFWATWCGPCMKLIPHEREIATQHADAPFVLLGVNADETDDETLKSLAGLNIPWPSFRDVRTGQKPISEEWQAAFPTVYLIDHRGILRKRFSGGGSPAVIKKAVDDLVNEAKTDAKQVTSNVSAGQ